MGFAGVALPLALVDGAVSALVFAFVTAPEALGATHAVIASRWARLAEARLLEVRATAAGW
jgi:hypothetical protein